MGTNLKLCKLNENFLEQSIDLFIDTFTQEPWYDKFESREQVETFFKNHLMNNYFVGYILKSSEDIIALSLGFKKPWIKGMEYYIDQFCVDIKYQGQGIGSKFMHLIEKDIIIKDMNAIILNTEKGYPSEKFYCKNGFDKLEELVILAK